MCSAEVGCGVESALLLVLSLSFVHWASEKDSIYVLSSVIPLYVVMESKERALGGGEHDCWHKWRSCSRLQINSPLNSDCDPCPCLVPNHSPVNQSCIHHPQPPYHYCRFHHYYYFLPRQNLLAVSLTATVCNCELIVADVVAMALAAAPLGDLATAVAVAAAVDCCSSSSLNNGRQAMR